MMEFKESCRYTNSRDAQRLYNSLWISFVIHKTQDATIVTDRVVQVQCMPPSNLAGKRLQGYSVI